MKPRTAYIIIIVSLSICVIILFSLLLFSSRDWEIAFKQPINFEATGQFGDYFGGVIGTLISLAALIFLFINLIEQRASLKKERFETRYFEMIKFHKENVSDLVFTTKEWNQKGNEELIIRNEGKKVFKVIDFDFIELFKELSPLFEQYKEEEIYVCSYLKDLKENSQLKERNINFKNYAKIDIVFSILLTGLSSQDRDTLSKVFDGRYESNLYETAIALAALKPKKESFFWKDWKSKSEEFLEHITKESLNEVNIYLEEDFEAFTAKIYRNLFDSIDKLTIKFDKYYGGHQFRLGHYFRNIFQTLNYINDNSDLSHEEKQENINLLKAQLSTFEQRLLFYHSVSFYGRKWELEKNKEPSKELDSNKRLITLYNLFENIPNDVIVKDEIIVSHYYPDMNLENKG